MKPIPNAAMPIVEYIREHVKRPEALPRSTNVAGGTHLRWFFGVQDFCPMGLLKNVTSSTPIFESQLLDVHDWSFTQDEITEVAVWWDSLKQSDALAACDAIWGKR